MGSLFEYLFEVLGHGYICLDEQAISRKFRIDALTVDADHAKAVIPEKLYCRPTHAASGAGDVDGFVWVVHDKSFSRGLCSFFERFETGDVANGDVQPDQQVPQGVPVNSFPEKWAAVGVMGG